MRRLAVLLVLAACPVGVAPRVDLMDLGIASVEPDRGFSPAPSDAGFGRDAPSDDEVADASPSPDAEPPRDAQDDGRRDAGFAFAGQACGPDRPPCAPPLSCAPSGVCCTSACAGPCERCGPDGSCGLAPPATPCGPVRPCGHLLAGLVRGVELRCMRYEGSVRGTCTSTGTCTPTSDAMCASQPTRVHAACDQACAHATPSCPPRANAASVDLGSLCELGFVTAACSGPRCQNGATASALGEQSCNASGRCVIQSFTSCDGYVCASNGTECLTACARAADCQTGLRCEAMRCER